MLTMVQTIDFQEQARKDAVAWVKTTKPSLSEKEVSAYGVGFSQGWHACVRTLKLHGYEFKE